MAVRLRLGRGAMSSCVSSLSFCELERPEGLDVLAQKDFFVDDWEKMREGGYWFQM